jgi:hypothetical protein
MRTSLISVAAMMLLSAAVCRAQEQSLGDVAHESRARAQDAKPSKVLTEDAAARPAITGSDDPAAVIKKAVAAMVHDTSHRCTKLNTGSAQGVPLSRTIEIAAIDRVHLSVNQESRRLAEVIEIGNDVYEKLGEGPWKKPGENERAGYPLNLLNLVPEEVKFGGGWKLVGQMVINGTPTFQYRMPLRTSDVDETVDLWIGASDYLPRRTQAQSRYLKENLTRDETTDCTYGLDIKIEPPL